MIRLGADPVFPWCQATDAEVSLIVSLSGLGARTGADGLDLYRFHGLAIRTQDSPRNRAGRCQLQTEIGLPIAGSELNLLR